MMLIKETATIKPSIYYYVRMLVMGIEVVIKFTSSFMSIFASSLSVTSSDICDTHTLKYNIYKINRAKQK